MKALVAPTLAMLAALAILLSLGTWQLARKGEKEALIAAVEARSRGPALALPPAPTWRGLDPEAFDYAKVRIEGRFRGDREAHVYGIAEDPRSRAAQPGWWIYAPFDLAAGGVLFVNRGFVPFELEEPGRRPGSAAPTGTVTLEGLVRRPEGRGAFTNPDDPARSRFYLRDPAAFARALGLGEVAPFTVDQSTPNPSGLPRAGLTRVTFPNRHLEYALTWYGLAATLVAVWAAFLWSRRRERACPPA